MTNPRTATGFYRGQPFTIIIGAHETLTTLRRHFESCLGPGRFSKVKVSAGRLPRK